MKTRTTGTDTSPLTRPGGRRSDQPRAAFNLGRWGRQLACAATLLAAITGTAAPAHAGTAPPTVYCVGTVAQLKSALAAIQTTPGSFDLRIRSGYYPLTPPGPGNLNYGLELRKIFRPNDGQVGFNRISGTWNEGCQQRAAVIDGTTSTLIDGQGQTGNLLVYSDSFAVGVQPTDIHELVIERLQFANGDTGIGASCVRVTPLGTLFYRLNVTVDRLRIELCEGTALNSQVEASVAVRNSVFLGNSHATMPGLSISAGEGVASLYNSTFRFNRMGAQNFPGQVRLSGSTVYVFNNLFADTDFGGNLAPIDVRVSEGTGIVRNNRLDGGVIHQQGGGLIQSGNTAVSPGFSNATGPQLANNSPLRDLGLTAVPLPGFGDLDFVGNPRVRGAAVDIGAFELAPLALPELVFANGFESP